MGIPPLPPLPDILARRIRLVRRDMSNLLFHFTRKPETDYIRIDREGGGHSTMPSSAWAVLRKILAEGSLIGTGTWTGGRDCVCFTEAPITEFNSIFSLVEIAASENERPRYEPYGIAVTKAWLFRQGGRPVIYDHYDSIPTYPESLRYRCVPFDPGRGTDFTWEREWRIRTSRLMLDPKHALVVVPTADEAFSLIYEHADLEPEWDVEGSSGQGYVTGAYHSPKWLAVSLDLFGVTFPTTLP